MFLWRRVAPQSPEEGLKPTAAPGYARNFRDLNRKISQGKSFSGYERNTLFLNLKGEGFADVAGLFGVDFVDDSRAVAVVDPDRDGDLDIWVANRTSPRVRLLRNNQKSANSFVAIRLIGNGKTTNRNAIGARLTLWPSSAPQLKQIRTVRAGDGFLSQSSAWAHFGLAQTTEILHLTIAWPGGETESLTDLNPNAHYVVTQGQGPRAIPVPAAKAVVRKAAEEPPEDPGAGGFWVANRVPFPQLTYTDATGAIRSTTDFQGKPVLVNLWATWCAPCLEELGVFARQADGLRARGATVLALNVDGLAVDKSAAPAANAEEVLARLDYGLPRGVAGQETLAKIEVLIEFLSSRRGPLSIPSSFLVDAEGSVAAVYLEALRWERLDGDLSLLNAPPATQLGRLSPRAGKWFADPRQADRAAYLGDYATLFVTNGFHEEAQRLYKMMKPQDGVRGARDFFNQAKSAAQQGLTEQAIEHYRAALRLDPDYGEALTGLGALLLVQKRVEEAQPLFEKALSIDPNHATALINLAMIDQGRGNAESALARLRQVIARNPDYAEARLNLGSLLASLKKHEEAIQHLSKAIELNPKMAVAHLNLAAAYVETRQWEKAEEHYRHVQSLNPRMAHAHIGLGNAQALQEKHADAVVSYRKAIALGGANARTYTQLALSLLSLGEKQPATEALQQALQLDPQYAPARRALRENGILTD
jgi:tetratricopeptide (TPR) repeat protein